MASPRAWQELSTAEMAFGALISEELLRKYVDRDEAARERWVQVPGGQIGGNSATAWFRMPPVEWRIYIPDWVARIYLLTKCTYNTGGVTYADLRWLLNGTTTSDEFDVKSATAANVSINHGFIITPAAADKKALVNLDLQGQVQSGTINGEPLTCYFMQPA